MNSISQDVRYAVRLLGKSPGFTAVAVLTLALGIGANTTIFSIVNAVLLRSLPVRNSEQLVLLKWSAHKEPSLHRHSTHGNCHEDKTRQTGCSFSLPFFEIAQAQHHLFSGVAAFAPQGRIDLSGNGSATVVNGQLVSGDYFRTLGIRPALGRTIELSDDAFDAAPVVVLNYGYWRNAFGGDPSAIGKTIKLNGLPFKIVGVTESRFRSLVVGNVFDVFIPLTFHRQLSPRWDSKWDEDRSWWLTIVARLKPEVSRQQAQAAMALLFRNAILDNPKFEFKPEDDPSVALASAQTGLTGAKTDMAPFLYLVMTAVVLILLIACANVAGLLLSRATTRQKEIAVRLALGAGRPRVVRQLLIESILLAGLGGAFGILLASWSLRVLIAWISSISPQTLGINVTIDACVLTFTLLVSFATGILFGLAPALRSTRVDLTPALKEGSGSATHLASRGTRWLHLGNSLVVAQVGLSVVVLIGAGLLACTLENLKRIDPGFDPRNVLLFAIDPSLAGYKGAPLQTLYKTLADQLSSIPGVNSVSYSETALITGSRSGTLVTYRSPGSSELLQIKTDWLPVSPGFFKTMRIPVLQGRAFTAEDYLPGSNLGTPDAVPPAAPTSVIVNEFFVRRYIGSMNPIGQMLDTEPKNPGGPPMPGMRIVGVVRDAKYKNLRTEINPTIHLPKDFEFFVQAKFLVASDHRDLFAHGLGDDLAVERVRVVRR